VARAAGLRERKKAQTRQHIADTAALLFAARGYDEVSIADVALAAEVSDQTVYNYFPLKEDLVFDRAEEFRVRLSEAVADRPAGTSPAHALRALAHIDIERHRGSVIEESRGEFPALCASSGAIRRGALELFDQQADAVAAAIVTTCPTIHSAVARAHAAALVSVFQLIADRTGRSVLDGTPPDVVADELIPMVEAVLDDLDRHFHRTTLRGAQDHHPAP
jgi:AcrR family transcriptional regulator